MNKLSIGLSNKKKMRLAIVGSRDYHSYEPFREAVNAYCASQGNPVIACIVSGGAQGVDSLARQYATEYQLPLQEFLPDWNTYGRAAGPKRNTQIVEACTHVLAFPSRQGYGTQDTIRKANAQPTLQDKIKVIYID